MKLKATVPDIDITVRCSQGHWIKWDASDLRRKKPLKLVCPSHETVEVPDHVYKSLLNLVHAVYETEIK